jgi:hypothetical protein
MVILDGMVSRNCKPCPFVLWEKPSGSHPIIATLETDGAAITAITTVSPGWTTVPLLGEAIRNELLWAKQGRTPRAKMIDIALLVIRILLR